MPTEDEISLLDLSIVIVRNRWLIAKDCARRCSGWRDNFSVAAHPLHCIDIHPATTAGKFCRRGPHGTTWQPWFGRLTGKRKLGT